MLWTISMKAKIINADLGHLRLQELKREWNYILNSTLCIYIEKWFLETIMINTQIDTNPSLALFKTLAFSTGECIFDYFTCKRRFYFFA